MKKPVGVWVCIVLLLFSACQNRTGSHADGMVGAKSSIAVQTSSDIVIDHIEVADSEVSFQIQNLSETEFTYGYGFSIEAEVDGAWHVTNYDAPDCPAGEFILSPGKTLDHVCQLFNDPPKGNYRVLIEVFPAENRSDSFYIAGEFTLD